MVFIANHPKSNPRRAMADIINQQSGGAAVVYNHDVGVAVVVDVSKRRSPADLQKRERRSRFAADVLEMTVTDVLQQQAGLAERVAHRLAHLLLDGFDGAVRNEKV